MTAPAIQVRAYGSRFLRPYLNANESLLIDQWAVPAETQPAPAVPAPVRE
jgi:hypothetical protein